MQSFIVKDRKPRTSINSSSVAQTQLNVTTGNNRDKGSEGKKGKITNVPPKSNANSKTKKLTNAVLKKLNAGSSVVVSKPTNNKSTTVYNGPDYNERVPSNISIVKKLKYMGKMFYISTVV